ncbi:HMG box factor, other [Cryptococcus gattii EJB2]|uniref:HMG box factor, other n=1 Tax=Cryptococcus gattii EJB2 TaxID=1296103 RepID=A0ABR5BPK5_9TREE|nr:HMG box factor, other [Cryptococcus gattii EJB2]
MEMDEEADEETLVTAKPKELAGTLDPKMVLENLKKEKADNCKKKVSHARKQTADHIPRPRNAFILFRKHVVDAKLIPASVEMRHQNVSIITAKMWSEASAEQKAHFNELARIEKEEHMKKYPDYRYQPVYRRTNVVRRRVRKDEVEEEKCKNVAELLMKGKSGQELEQEIKEKVASGVTKGAKKDKASSRRPNGACELSKGALRALRAQARQRQQSFNSGDWSDLPRSTSIDPDAQGSRQRQYSAFEMTGSLQSPQPDDGSQYGLVQGQNQVPSGQLQYMAYSHPGPAPWSSDVPAEHNKEQAFTFTSAQQDFQPDQQGPPTVSITSHTYPSTSRDFLYPQPQPQFQLTIMSDQQASNEFYAHDAALPFSPSAGQFTFQDQSDSMHINAMPIFDVGSAQQRIAHPPMSARWDMGHLLPPSSDVPLEGLPFDDGLILGDFETALAHADDMIGGVIYM